MSKEEITPEVLIEKVNAPILAGDDAIEIIETLKDCVQRGQEYLATANAFECKSQQDIDSMALTVKAIDADMKAVTTCLASAKKEAYSRHKLFTTAENTAIRDAAEAKRIAKQKASAWLSDQREKARLEQERLQREADERARKEREALEKKAAAMKTEAKREEYLAKADEVITPEVNIETPNKGAMRLQERWQAEVTDAKAFLRWLADNHADAEQFVEIKTSALLRAKKGWIGFKPDGVRFEKVLS